MMQFIVVPSDPEFELQPMSSEEAAECEVRGRRIRASRCFRLAACIRTLIVLTPRRVANSAL